MDKVDERINGMMDKREKHSKIEIKQNKTKNKTKQKKTQQNPNNTNNTNMKPHDTHHPFIVIIVILFFFIIIQLTLAQNTTTTTTFALSPYPPSYWNGEMVYTLGGLFPLTGSISSGTQRLAGLFMN